MTLASSLMTQTQPGQAQLDSRLLDLLRNLRDLPKSLSDHSGIYPFASFVLDSNDVEHYGSLQGALNHRLELIFGSRSGARPVEFRGRGPSLEAVVYIFYKYIDGEDGENLLLWKWVQDLTHAAKEASKTVSQLSKPSTRRPRASRGGRKSNPMPKSKPTEAKVKAAKAASAVRYPFDPADLEDEPLADSVGRGRIRNELLDKLLIPCHSITDPSHLRVRCRGVGCGWSWAEPRGSGRVLRHASACEGLDNALRSEAKQQSASLSLASKLKGTSEDDGPEGALVSLETQQQKNTRVNHALLKWLCDRMIPPTAVDCLRWRELVSTLDPNATTASGTTIADNFITTEAAYIHQESINMLSQQEQLTLSFDGGTTRKHESVYTVHVTTPLTREAHLMEGNEASGVSHTAEHVCSVIDKTLKDIGPEHFTSVVSDNAGNTRAARALIEQEYPWIIALQDACHQLNNAAKDIGQLNYFQPCIVQLRTIITFFHSSNFAARHLSALRVVYHIAEGLVAIGITRFVTYYYASRATLRCLPLIRELISSGVLDPKPASPIYWMLDRVTVQKFEAELNQLVALLEPFARSIKCLESSHSTLSDVYLFWLAILARFQNMFRHNQSLSGFGLPESVIREVTGILNNRHTEMIHGQAGQVYIAAFFLDIRYRGSDIFLRHPARLSTETWASQHIPSGANLLPDQDLRHSLPAYTQAGNYLVKLLGRIYNKNPDAPLFARYANWSQIETSFRNQLVLYTRGLSPFNQVPKTPTEHTYWDSLCSIPTADLLAHLGLVLSSIVPNSMAEERSMSTITKLNSPDRASQKVSTVIDMTTIRQHYKREENRSNPSVSSFRPTTRFADLPQPVLNTVPANSPVAPLDIDQQTLADATEWFESALELRQPVQDQHEETRVPQDRNIHHFEVELTDGVSLSSKLLADMLIDCLDANTKHSRSPEPATTEILPPRKRQKVDVSSLEY